MNWDLAVLDKGPESLKGGQKMADVKIVGVKELAKELKMSPKKVRRQLRRKKLGVGFGKKYEWPKGGVDYKRVLGLLTPKKEEEKEKEPSEEEKEATKSAAA